MADIFELESYSDTPCSAGAVTGSTRYGQDLNTGDLR